MSTGDMVFQTIVVVICIVACWLRWGKPLYDRLWARARQPMAQAHPLLEALLAGGAIAPFQQANPVQDRPNPVPAAVPVAPSPALEEVGAQEEADAELDPPEDEDDDMEDEVEADEEDEDEEGEEELAAPIAAAPPIPTPSPVSAPSPAPILKTAQPILRVSPQAAWEAWLKRVYAGAVHLITIGSTGAGKTTVLHAFVRSLTQAGIPVVVGDPDATVGDWEGAEVYGAGDDFDAINAAAVAIGAIVRERRQARAAGQREFPPLWVVFDEYFDIQAECSRVGTLVEGLLRRARKLNIHLVIGVQDTQVKTMGFDRRSELLRNARIVTIKLNAAGQRTAQLAEEAPVRVPDLTAVLPTGDATSTPTPTPAQVLVLPELSDDDDDIEEDDTVEPGGTADGKDAAILVLLDRAWSYANISRALNVSTTRISRVKRSHTLDLS